MLVVRLERGGTSCWGSRERINRKWASGPKIYRGKLNIDIYLGRLGEPFNRVLGPNPIQTRFYYANCNELYTFLPKISIIANKADHFTHHPDYRVLFYVIQLIIRLHKSR